MRRVKGSATISADWSLLFPEASARWPLLCWWRTRWRAERGPSTNSKWNWYFVFVRTRQAFFLWTSDTDGSGVLGILSTKWTGVYQTMLVYWLSEAHRIWDGERDSAYYFARIYLVINQVYRVEGSMILRERSLSDPLKRRVCEQSIY